MSFINDIGLLGFSPAGWGMALLYATMITFLLSISALMIGACIGGVAAAYKIRRHGLGYRVASIYVTVFRGIPDLLTIYFIYFGSSWAVSSVASRFGLQGFYGVPALLAAVFALSVTSGAYQAEVYRGAFAAINKGQIEAARAFAMTRTLVLRRILIPQLLRHAIPGLSNVWQLLLKDSALVSVIGVVELMRQAQIAAGSTKQSLLFYGAAAALYLIIAVTSGSLFRLAEASAWRGERRA